MARTWVRLKDQSAVFWDKELMFGLARDEIRPLPDDIPPGSLTARWLNAGGLVPCEGPQPVAPASVAVEPQDDSAESDMNTTAAAERVSAERADQGEVSGASPKPAKKRTTKKK